MAFITGKFFGGNCDNIRVFSDRIECSPTVREFAKKSGMTNLLYDWRCLVVGKPNEKVNIVLHWPCFDADKVDKKQTYWFVQSFGEVVENVIFMSEDEILWTRIENIEREGFDFKFSVTLPSSGELYVATNIPFTYKALKEACEEFKENRIHLGETVSGVDIPTFRFGTGKKVIWLQANVHVIEMSGCHVLISLMRYLKKKGDLGDFSFFVVPSLVVERLLGDISDGEKEEDANRNWGHLTQYETKAVDGFIKNLVAEGYEMLVMTDMHNGWCRSDDSGGNITEYNRGFIEEDYWQRRVKFTKELLKSTDFERDDKIWWGDLGEIKTFFQYGSQKYGALCTTMEFSRFKLFDRAVGDYVPMSQQGLYKFGEQYAEFLMNYNY